MLKRVTLLLFLVVLFLMDGPASAQPTEVSVRQLNALPAGNVDLLNAIGADPDGMIPTLIQPALQGDTLVVTVVVLSDPLNSGLASWVTANAAPGRIHIFARDTSAVSQGMEGMGLQIVDGNFATTGSINALIGDVLRVTGTISFFGTAMQFTAITIEPQGHYSDFGIPDSILDPVTITTADLNMMVAAQQNQANWGNYESLIHQYVRIENATILRRTLASSGRPNWNFSTDGGDTFTQNDDISLRFRNDRGGSYQPPFNVRSDPFEPPPVGSNVNVQGFVVFRGAFETFDFVGLPSGAFMQVAPFADTDLEVTALPNVRSVAVSPLTEVPGDAALTATVNVEADADAIASVTGTWTNATTDATGTIDFTARDDSTYLGNIPAQADGDFVSFSVSAQNTDGIEFLGEDEVNYRVLFDGINEIADIQETVDGGAGSSPFAGFTLPMDLTATVQTDPATSELIGVQDDAALGGWSGIVIRNTDELIADLQRGDVINITSAQIEESFDLTRLRDITYTTVTEGGDSLGYKTVTTDVLQDEAISEAHEGMALQFDDVVITSIERFGEWEFASTNDDGSLQGDVRGDDQSESLPGGSDMFGAGERLEFLRGLWSYSFGDYKLWPESATDVGMVTNVATEEDDVVPETFALDQNYPNPFNPTTRIAYTVPATGKVRLEVFDTLGRSIAVLVNSEQAVGTYTVQFDAANFASGLYLYRLTAGAKTTTKTMMLLK